MKAQTTIVVALLAVLGILLASTSATTYSWWSDSDEADIEITSGYLDAVTSEVYFWSGDVDTQKTNADFADLNKFDKNANIFINSEDYKVKIQYTVEFKANIDAQYKISIDAHMNDADSVSVTETYVKDGVSVEGPSIWTPLDTTDGVEASVKYIVTALVEFRGVPQGITSDEAKDALSIKNEITQYGAVNETYVPAGDSDRDVEVLGTDGNLWNVGVEFTDVSNVSVLDVDIDSVAGSDNSFIINLSLDDGVTFYSAKISIIIPGVINDGMVVYLGDGSQPTDVTITNDRANTTVTFITNHFSEFMFFDNVIDSVDEFVMFGKFVNDYGFTFNNKTVSLATDLDLKGIKWIPIGLNADNAKKFHGTFEGNDNTISNLNVHTEPGYTAAGLFGALDGTVQNLTIRGASINHISTSSATDNGIAVVAGSLYNSGHVYNVTVKDSSVSGNRYVGGIVGYAYGNITGCSVSNVTLIAIPDDASGSYDNGDKVGGIVGYWSSESTYNLKNNSVSDISVTGYRDIGLIVGCANIVSKDNVSENIVGGTNTLTIDQRTNHYGDKAANAGTIVGRFTNKVSDPVNNEVSGTVYVNDASALKDACTMGNNIIIVLADGEYITNFIIPGGKTIVIQGNGDKSVLKGQIATTSSVQGTLTLNNLVVKVSDDIVDSTGISQTGKSAIAIWGNQKVICEDVTFDMSLDDSTAITSWWDTGVGTSIVVKDCTFNCNGQRPIRATGNVTVEGSTFDDPYRYAVQLTAKASTAIDMDKATIVFNNNRIIDGVNGKNFVYGIQLEGSDYGCHDLVITGSGNTIVNGGEGSAMYYCECGKVDHTTLEFNAIDYVLIHESLSDYINDYVNSGVTEIVLPAGHFAMPNTANGKTLTFTGQGESTIIEVVPVGGQGEAGGQLDYNLDSSTVTFNNLVIKTNNKTYAGYARLTATYNGCIFDNCYCLNGDSVFNECTFNVSGDQYNIWTWGAPNATFNDCTFNSDGKAILLYGQANTKLTVNKCTFNDSGVLPDFKAAIEIGNDYNASYELIVNNTTVNGYEINDKGINTGTTLWGNKNSMSQESLNVVIDGVEVY